ncbi:MAG TPA: NAD(P)/FAD-dependent oxidoreductase [Lacipirellulaceae bacterium]|jgi:flavin-dependent dehydrogenase|nr:NAD(P)/FAD-dependent oxidoreductase [Lacipirellulaceae bacterium]
MKPSSTEYDCIVMGGGPSGSTSAALVADAGCRVLLLERDVEPRRKVGESLMPETYWIFERLGILDQLKTGPFVEKVGVQFISSSGKESSPFLFTQHDPRPCGRTWHVERTKFDPFLLENAAKKGVEVHRGARVLDVVFEGDRAVGVKLAGESSPDKASNVIRAKVVVDATGQAGLLGARFADRTPNPAFRKAAIWGHFRGSRRDVIENGVMTVCFRTQSNRSWFWHIPLSNDVVSIGCVSDADYFFRQDAGTPDEIFAQEVVNCPAMAKRLEGAELVAGLDIVKEYSYTTGRSSGDGWVLVGDSWGFIDPIYSSGVYFALKSGQLAADAIIEGLETGDTSAKQLGKWVDEFAVGTSWVRKLAEAWYCGQFRVGKFIREYPQHIGPMTDILIGRIFHEGAGDMFSDLDPWLDRMKAEGVTS